MLKQMWNCVLAPTEIRGAVDIVRDIKFSKGFRFFPEETVIN